MAFSQQLLQAITNLQANAQERLPVLPNNGNPRGANNMPVVPQGQPPVAIATDTGVVPAGTKEQPAKSPYAYPWLAPSASVERIRNMLSPAVQQPQPVNLNQQQPISQTQPMVPVLPTRRGEMY